MNIFEEPQSNGGKHGNLMKVVKNRVVQFNQCKQWWNLFSTFFRTSIKNLRAIIWFNNVHCGFVWSMISYIFGSFGVYMINYALTDIQFSYSTNTCFFEKLKEKLINKHKRNFFRNILLFVASETQSVCRSSSILLGADSQCVY